MEIAMRPQIAAALIGLAFAFPPAVFAQQKAPGASVQKPKFAVALPKPPGAGTFANAPAPGAGPNGAPPAGLYHYRVHVTDQAGNAAAPKLVDDLAAVRLRRGGPNPIPPASIAPN
jgi:hypothetical protein